MKTPITSVKLRKYTLKIVLFVFKLYFCDKIEKQIWHITLV